MGLTMEFSEFAVIRCPNEETYVNYFGTGSSIDYTRRTVMINQINIKSSIMP